MPNISVLKNSSGVLLHSYPIDALRKFSFHTDICHSIWIGLIHTSYNVQDSTRLRKGAFKYKWRIFYQTVSGPCAYRERIVCVPWADRVRTAIEPCAYRDRTLCVPSSDRVRTVSGPCAYRHRTVCVPAKRPALRLIGFCTSPAILYSVQSVVSFWMRETWQISGNK
jgi:hypothetical protein